MSDDVDRSRRTPRRPAAAVRWRARILIRGVNPYVRVRPAIAARLRRSGSGPIPVRIQVNGEPNPPWRINMVPAGDGGFYLYLHGQVRQASRTRVGDLVEVEAAFDKGYRGGPTHPMPSRLAKGLARDPEADRRWRALPPSRQKELLRYLAALRSAAARDRNVDRALLVLGGGTARFLGREWNGRTERER